MAVNSGTFDQIMDRKIQYIRRDFSKAENFELAIMGAHLSCLLCIKQKGYSYISQHIYEKNNCDSGYLDYDNLSWDELLNKIFTKRQIIFDTHS